MSMRRLACAFAVVSATTSALWGQSGEDELLARFNPAKDTVVGNWDRVDDGLRVTAKVGARCMIPASLPDTYRLRAEFTRKSGNDVVAFLLPVGGVTAVVELSSWRGEAHGLARVDEQTSRSPRNPTSVRPGKLENGQRYRVDISVTQTNGSAAIEADLDGKSLFRWRGTISRLSPHFLFKLPDTQSLGLGVGNCEVVFHSLRLIRERSTAPSSNPSGTNASKSGVVMQIDLAGLLAAKPADWNPFGGARFVDASTSERKAVASSPAAGRGDRGAFIGGIEFASGVIEVDLRGSGQPQSSFLGVVFHAVDAENYEAIYFRPFNFRSADSTRRSHAVQYIAHPDWPWDRLRREKAGQYEAAVRPEPKAEDWFHARIVVSDDRVRVFLAEAEQPSLDVRKLNSRTRGRVGLWFNGIAEFANLSLRPQTGPQK